MTTLVSILILACLWAQAAWGDWGGTQFQSPDSMNVNMILDGSVDENNGALDYSGIDNEGAGFIRFLLLRPAFDRRTAGYTQDSAILHLFLNATDFAVEPDANESTLVELFALKRVWGEGVGTEDPSSAGESDWGDAVEGTTAWTTAGAQHADDRNTTPFLSDTLIGAIVDQQELTFTVPASAIEDCIAYGVIIERTDITEVTPVWFYTDDDDVQANRPYFQFFETAPGAGGGSTSRRERILTRKR